MLRIFLKKIITIKRRIARDIPKEQQDLEEITKNNLLQALNILLPVTLSALGCRLIWVCFCPKRHQLGPLQSEGQSFICLFLCSSIEGPYVGSWKGPTASAEDVYDPKPQAPETELPTEEIQPTTVETYDRLGKLPAATHILDSILNNYDYKLRPGIGGE